MRRERIRVLAVAVTAWAVGCVPAPSDSPDAGGATEEAPPVDAVLDAAWSADGRRLAVTWAQGDRSRLVGLFGPHDGAPPAEGSGLPLASGEAGWASWSPDGLWVAYAAGPEGSRDLVRARPDGTGAERLTDDPGDDYDPAFSPDGRTLAFVSTRGGGTPRLHVMDAGGGEARVLADLGGPVRRPSWSPAGRTLAVEVGEAEGPVIYVVTADGSGTGRIGTGKSPAWFPDGRRLVFTENDSLFWRPTDGGLRRLLLPDARAGRPSPDGRWVAFVRGDGTRAGLYLLDTGTGDTTRITPR